MVNVVAPKLPFVILHRLTALVAVGDEEIGVAVVVRVERRRAPRPAGVGHVIAHQPLLELRPGAEVKPVAEREVGQPLGVVPVRRRRELHRQ